MARSITEEQSNRFRAQFARVRESIIDQKVQVGNAQVVVYSEEEQAKYKIASFGRMTLNDGQYTFFAGPKRMADNPQVEYKNTFKNLGKVFAQQGTIQTEYAPEEWAKVSFTGNANFVRDAEIVTKSFFKDEVVIQNPSQTLIECGLKIASKVKVVIKNKKIREEFEGDKRVCAVADHKGSTPVFCGMSLPNQDYERWFAMIPNPYFEHLGVRVSLEEQKDKFVINVQRGGKEYQWLFENGTLKGYDNIYIYPSHQLQSMEMTKAHFLVSNYDLHIASTKSEFLYTSPQFLPPDPLVKERQGDLLVWRDAKHFIYDVKELRSTEWLFKGTYYSRRARYPELKWVPYVESGRPVSFFSICVSQKRLTEQPESFYYCGRYLREKDVEGETRYMFASDFKGINYKKIAVKVSRIGQFQIMEEVPKGYVLYDSEYEWATSSWLLRDQQVDTVVEALKEDHSLYDHPGGREHAAIQNLTSNLEYEEGVSETFPASVGIRERQMRHAGFVKYKDQWYKPTWAGGIIRTGMVNSYPHSFDCEGITYAYVFAVIETSTDRRKHMFLGQQVLKVKEILFEMGFPSVVKAPGLLYVIK